MRFFRCHVPCLRRVAARLLQVTVVAMLFVSVLTVSCDVMRHGAAGTVNACVEHSLDAGFSVATDIFHRMTTAIAVPIIFVFTLLGISTRAIPRGILSSILERMRFLRGLWARKMPFISSKRFLPNFSPVRDF